MKKILLVVITALLLLPTTVKAQEKVKVYIFEAGGCPYCEMEIEYLKGLDSYNETFEIVRKELYIDHKDWEPGKDYELGYNVANAFLDAGFENATYHSTPFVVISDTYASSGYNTSLENIINQAYLEGDKDAVECIKNGNKDCIRQKEGTTKKETKEVKKSNNVVIIAAIVIVAAGMLFLVRSSLKEINK